jgi:protease-4
MIYNEILRLKKLYPKKPVEVVIEEVCASGCYYIAAAADKIYASPSSIVGSIGVIYTGFGLNKLMDKMGIDSRLIISGKNKAMGYPFIPSNSEQNVMQQKMLDKVHAQFINAVKKGRGSRLNNDPDLFSGRYWIGEDALPLGLIDGFASVDSLARDLFKTDNLVEYTPDSDALERIVKKLGVGLVDSAKQEAILTQFGKFN